MIWVLVFIGLVLAALGGWLWHEVRHAPMYEDIWGDPRSAPPDSRE